LIGGGRRSRDRMVVGFTTTYTITIKTGKTKLANVIYEWGRSALVLVNWVSGIPSSGTLSQIIVQ